MELNIHHIIPDHVERALGIGPLPAAVSDKLAALPHGSCCDLSQAGPPGTGLGAGSLECIVWFVDEVQGREVQRQMPVLLPALAGNGQLSLVFPGPGPDDEGFAALDQWLAQFQLIRYHAGPLAGVDPDRTFHAVTAVGGNYNPVAHARQLARQGRPDLSLAIIDHIPEGLIPDVETMARLNVEGQRYCLMWQQRMPNDPVHARYFAQLRRYAQATTISPYLVEAYRLYAQYFHHMGRTDMALRVLRSIQHVRPEIETAVLISQWEALSPSPPARAPVDLPVWQGLGRRPRILVLNHGWYDYGLDTLIHGLCELLGAENVIDYPWKPTLHGQSPESANDYPCVFAYPGRPAGVPALIAEIEQGRFDFILYADVVSYQHREQVRALVKAARHIPLVLYDTWDDCHIPMPLLREYLGGRRFDLCFKRELLAGVAYESDPLPLPFSYPEMLVSQGVPGPKSEPFFWAGKRDYGLRQLYIPYLQQRFGRDMMGSYSQQAYQTALRGSRIGLSFFGCGFDTVRYWEVPANGVMLLAERLPIQIPHDFVDGVSAVFFDDLPDLENKLDYYLRHPELTDAIAAAGHAHYRRYHTSIARARQFLGAVHARLGWPDAL